MKPLVLIIGFLIFGAFVTAASCETSAKEQVQYDGGREWLITKSIGSANGTSTTFFWGSGPGLASNWNKSLDDRMKEGRPDAKARVSLSVEEGQYELQFFDAVGNLADSLKVQGGNEETLEIELPKGALEYGRYGASASDAKGVRYEIRLVLPFTIAEEQANSGNDLLHQGRLGEAIAKYDEAIRLNPKLAVAYANRGIARTHLHKDLEAQQDIERAIELGADHAELERIIKEIKQQR